VTGYQNARITAALAGCQTAAVGGSQTAAVKWQAGSQTAAVQLQALIHTSQPRCTRCLQHCTLVHLGNWAPGQLGVLGCLGLLGTWVLGLLFTAVSAITSSFALTVAAITNLCITGSQTAAVKWQVLKLQQCNCSLQKNTSHDAQGVCSIGAFGQLGSRTIEFGCLAHFVLRCLGYLGPWAIGLYITAVSAIS
jgi:hypothetical protein